MLRKNEAAVEVVSLLCVALGQVVAGTIFFAPMGVALAAVGPVLTTLANNCDMGATLQAEARQAAIAIRFCAIVATVAAPFTAGATLPIASVCGPLASMLDSVGQSKTPKLADVAAFGAAAGGAANVDTSSINTAASVVKTLPNTSQVQALVGQLPKAQQSTKADVDAAWFATVRVAMADALFHNKPLDQALAPFTVKQPGNRSYGPIHVVGFLSDWAKAGKPMDARAFSVWNTRLAGYPFTSAETAKVTALDSAKVRARELTLRANGTGQTTNKFQAPMASNKWLDVKTYLPKSTGTSSGTPAPSSPPATKAAKPPMKTSTKVTIAATVASALLLVFKAVA